MPDTTVPEKKPGAVPPILLGSSPHIALPISTTFIMGNMLVALLPVSIFGIIIFGVPALLNILVSVLAAIAGETLFRLVTRQPLRIKDLSAGVSGLLLALVIPPSTPLWMTALGAVFAVVVAKEFFGGLGANVFNPALVGRAFLLMSFPAAMTTWPMPASFATAVAGTDIAGGIDAVSGATPLAVYASGGVAPAIKALFFGHHGGCTGETSIMLILAAFMYLLVTRTIDWRAPVSMAAAACVTSLILRIDPLFSLLSGGLLFGAVFMTTDYVTAPLTAKGKVIFGIGAGVITILIRKWGTYPEGVSYAILIMNAATPFLNKLLPRKYGYVPKKKPLAGGMSSTPHSGKGATK